MKVLITAGSTIVPIDKVRVISNIFKGKTGTLIAQYFAERGAMVTLLTSNPELMKDYDGPKIKVATYKNFNDLFSEMELYVPSGGFDAIIHSAAVSDYECSGAYVMQKRKLEKLNSKTKISSRHKELFLKFTPTPKIVDYIKKQWNFKGVLVKFKLEVGLSYEALIDIATKSMNDSNADLIVANCLEWSSKRAYLIGGKNFGPKQVKRCNLPKELYKNVEVLL